MWEQHERCFHTREEDRDPLNCSGANLLQKLCKWMKNGDEVILMDNFNQHIYEGKLQEGLVSDDIGLEE